MKLEFFNPLSSVKDRIGRAMIEAAEESGILTQETHIIEPADSPVISGGKPGLHKIQGIGAGFVPKNLDTSLLSGVETVTNDEAVTWARRLAREEGILAGISTEANVAAIRAAGRPESRGKVIVTIAPSCCECYLSTVLFQELPSQVSAHHARLASGCWPDSSGRAWLPAGFHRKVSRCILHLILLSQVRRSARTQHITLDKNERFR